jgi:hypothetical protein
MKRILEMAKGKTKNNSENSFRRALDLREGGDHDAFAARGFR